MCAPPAHVRHGHHVRMLASMLTRVRTRQTRSAGRWGARAYTRYTAGAVGSASGGPSIHTVHGRRGRQHTHCTRVGGPDEQACGDRSYAPYHGRTQSRLGRRVAASPVDTDSADDGKEGEVGSHELLHASPLQKRLSHRQTMPQGAMRHVSTHQTALIRLGAEWYDCAGCSSCC